MSAIYNYIIIDLINKKGYKRSLVSLFKETCFFFEVIYSRLSVNFCND